jgi:FMN phosphatase YigB (HAD superfamily)
LTATRLVVLDFDGTVCLGDDPVLSYARHLDVALAGRDGGHTGGLPSDGLVERTLRLFLEGPDAVQADVAEGAGSDAGDLALALEAIVDSADGYAAAAKLAGSQGIDDAALAGAYAASRQELADGLLETWAPPGLAAFLGTVRHTARIVLVTNATSTGVAQQLAHLGLDDAFDEVVTDAGKPAGMAGILERLRAEHGLSDAPDRLLSVGDIWRNDLAPAAEQGSATALIERFAAPDAAPTFRAATFESLYPDLGRWAAAPASPASPASR